MTDVAAPEVKGRSIRVALTATVVVAVTYFVIALAVATFVTGDLTNKIDSRLTGSLRNVPREPPDRGNLNQRRHGCRSCPAGPAALPRGAR